MARNAGPYVKLPPLMAQWPAAWRELYEERAGIKEFEGNLARGEAERQAEQEVRLDHKVAWMEGSGRQNAG